MDELQPLATPAEGQIRRDADYAFLREQGIELLQQLTGNRWTDYNVHDPGVTILEYLCYAITDFSYRADFDIKDILTTQQDGLIDGNKNALYPLADILTTKPITISDYRKIIIDSVEEVENVWIEHLSDSDAADGYYKVLLQTNKKVEYDMRSNPKLRERIINDVSLVLNANRNLGEQFKKIEVLEAQEVSINARVLINNKVNPERILAEIFYQIERRLNGRVQFYTLRELMQTGLPVDEIVQGPKLKNGYLPDDSLKPRVKEITVSDINMAILGIEGVENVKGLSVALGGSLQGGDYLLIEDGKYPVLNTNYIDAIDNFSIRIFKENFEYPIDRNRMGNTLRDLWATSFRSYVIAAEGENRPPLPQGTYREMDLYFSIQNDFPKNYLIDELGLPKNVPKARKAQANQLKGFLMPFEQILAGYFSQLQRITDLFSINMDHGTLHTYFTQPLYAVPDVDRLIKAFDQRSEKEENRTEYRDRWEKFKSGENEYTKEIWRLIESTDEFIERKNRILDHLLARFGEYIDDYSLSSFRSYYGDKGGTEKARSLRLKSMMLRDYVNISYNRSAGLNYRVKGDLYWNTTNQSGLERKVSLLLGITNREKRRLANLGGNVQIKPNKEKKKSNTDTQVAKVHTVNWSEEELQILESDNLDALKIGNKNNEPNGFVFSGSKRQVMKNALLHGSDIRNYRVGQLSIGAEKKFVVVHKAPDDEQWHIVSKHDKRNDAFTSLNKTIDYLLQLSIDSEGFHLVEHALLEHALEKEKFGFYIKDKRGKQFLLNYFPVTYFDRFQLASDILKFGKQRENYYMDRVNSKEYRIVIHNDQEEPIAMTTSNFTIENYGGSEAEEATRRILRIIDLMNEQEQQFKANVSMFTTMADGTRVDADFFDFQATLVLPDWPARFQDDGFKIYLQNTFRAHAPAHMRLNFLWVDMFDMQLFEDLFDKWLTSLNDENKAGSNVEDYSEELISFLLQRIKA